MSRITIINHGPGPIQVRTQLDNTIADMGEGTRAEFTAPLIVLTPDEVAQLRIDAPDPVPAVSAEPPALEGDDPPLGIAFALAKTGHSDEPVGVVLTEADALADLNGTPRPDNPTPKAAEQMPPLTAKAKKQLAAAAAA